MISGKSSSGSNKNLVRAIRMDFTIKRGDYFSYVYDISSIDSTGTEVTADLTGYYAQMHLKRKKGDIGYITAMATVIDSSAGTITFSKTGEEWRDEKIAAGTYWYDLEIKDSDDKNITWIEGKFKILQDVTEWVDEVEELFNHVFDRVYQFIKGKSISYPITIGLVYNLAVSLKAAYKMVFTELYSFKIVSTALKLPKIVFTEIFKMTIGAGWKYKTIFESINSFLFMQILYTSIEFYEVYSFYNTSSGTYTEQVES